MTETNPAGDDARNDTKESQTDKIDWDDVGYVTASVYRVTAVDKLGNGPATPSQIAKEGCHDIAHISRALNSMRDRGLVKLLVSDDRKKGRIYALTNDGELASEHVPNNGGEVA